MKAIVALKKDKKLQSTRVQPITLAPLEPHQLKIRVSSSRINPVDIQLMKGMPFLPFKRPQMLGVDGAGTVLEVGSAVNGFKVGDAVYFYRRFDDIGTWAEEIQISADWVAHAPKSLPLGTVGGITLPLLTAYDALKQLNAPHDASILIHGAGGGVGFQAVQFARHWGFKVYATASGSDIELLQKLGIENVIDYKSADFSTKLQPQKVDYVFDTVGGETLLKSISLTPKSIISVHYIEPMKMGSVGMNPPALLRPLLKLVNSKYDKAAKKEGVQLIGQVSAPSGKILSNVANTIDKMDFQTKPVTILPFLELPSVGIQSSDIGKVLHF